MSFARNFAMGQQIAQTALDTYEKGKLRSELAKIYKDKPEQLQGFTPEQGEQLRLAGESGQNDIGYDEARKAYTITPKAGGEATLIPMQPVTDFLGNRTAGSMSDQQVNTARLRSAADILGARDPLAGLQLRDQLTRGERDDQRFAWEKSRNEREERGAAQKESDEKLMRGIDTEVGESIKQRLTQPDGTQRDMTVDDYLYGSQMRAARLLAAGKSSEAGQAIKDYQAQSFAKIQLETAKRNEALGQAVAALNAGDFSQVRDFYNTYVPDGMRVTDVVQDPKTGAVTIRRETIDGRPAPDTVIKDTGQLTAAMATFKDPMAVYNWSQNEFQNSLRVNQDRRAENADRRAAASADQSNADRQQRRNDAEAQANAAVKLAEEEAAARGETLSDARREAIRRGVVDPFPKPGKNAPSEVRLAEAALEAGVPGVTNMASALQWARTSRDKSPTEIRASIFQESLRRNFGSVPAATRDTDAAMKYLYPESKAAAPSGNRGEPQAQTQTPLAARVQQPAVPAAGQRREADGSISGRIGSQPKPLTGASAPTSRKTGEERVIQSGQHKGKTAVWDGQGWNLK
jgi:hypothetical protein